MLRQDNNAGIYWVRRQYTFFRRYHFKATGIKRLPMTSSILESKRAEQIVRPARIATKGRRTWWWFQGAFYYEDDGYTAEDVVTLLQDRQRKSQRQLQRARDMQAAEQAGVRRREHIPREIRRTVFTRDGGRCVECGSNFDLQYDHVIPVALGGATTVENLRVLCADCNRAKSDEL